MATIAAMAGQRAFLISMCCVVLFIRPAAAWTEPSEVKALLAFRDSVRARGGNWLQATKTWICDDENNCDPCGSSTNGWGSWKYVGCRTITGAPQGRVTNIHLTDLELEGPFPASELCALKELRELDMDGNFLYGPLEEWAPTCWPYLRELDLSWTPIGGQLPSSLAQLRGLEEIKLRYAGLNGQLPPELGNMPNLRVLALQGNDLSGSIPAEYATGPMARVVQQINLQDNPRLSGTVPDFAPLRYACCWCHWRWCGVYLQGTAVDVASEPAASNPILQWGVTRRAVEPACEPKCPWKAVSDPPPPDVFELERAGVMALDHSRRTDAGDLPPPDGSSCEERAQWSGCGGMNKYGFCAATCGAWGA